MSSITQNPHVNFTENFPYQYEAKQGNVLDVAWTVNSGTITVITSNRNLVTYPTPQPTTEEARNGAPASKAGDSESATNKIIISASSSGKVDVTLNISERKKA
jgi:hypothetical protein